MANMKEVNKGIKANFPSLNIEAARGGGYVYFDGDDGFDRVRSIMINPASVSTDDLIDMCMQEIQDYLISEGKEV